MQAPLGGPQLYPIEINGAIFPMTKNVSYLACRIFDIEWDGTSFTARVDVPNFRVLTFEGTADEAALSAKLFTGEDRSIDFEAQSAATWEKATAATTSGP